MRRAILLLTTCAALAAPAVAGAACPTSVDQAHFASTNQLLALNQVESDFGQRPTGSPNHRRFVHWLDARLRAIDGLEVKAIPYKIDRWLERSAGLYVAAAGAAPEPLAISGAVPYAEPTTAGGSRGALIYVPHGTAIAAQDVRGKVVVRDAVPGSVPNAAFQALAWASWDPELTLPATLAGNYERDYLAYQERIDDLRAAARSGAAALVFVHGFPREQVRGQYAPYEGERWHVPAVYVGIDEGERLKALARAGGRARVTLSAQEKRVTTKTLVATLPGQSAERIVVESHTDGMNAIWDNGPIAILPLAEHFAALPNACRPRTLQFVLNTAHLYQRLVPQHRDGGAQQIAEQLDRDYEKGTVALVLAMEHMGAREYEARPRGNGLPGRTLVKTGRSEVAGIFVGESPVLVEEVLRDVITHDLRRTVLLRGADLPGVHIPTQHSFGGEGTPYNHLLLPTVALVSGPWSLYNPAFGMEGIDGELLRRQTLVFADLVHAVGAIPRELLAGAFLGERAARTLVCSRSADGFGLFLCPAP